MLIESIKKGDWILLDEINLAQSDLLQKILPILNNQPLIIIDEGKMKPVSVHENFRLFACMNPTGIGKKPLPRHIEDLFSVIKVPEINLQSELKSFIFGKIGKCFDN